MKTIIQELNVLFKKRGWYHLPEENDYDGHVHKQTGKHTIPLYWSNVIRNNVFLNLHRDNFHYNKHIHKFTSVELDAYIVEFIKPICKKYNIKSVNFRYLGENSINELLI
ncbi:hypothetical protein COB55_03815 [Candidatus Wolfebacteria bacterium]|nr:MAG: hypothetical protein COB55_03815 [Candidatus Wolfebacteria bacterium]